MSIVCGKDEYDSRGFDKDGYNVYGNDKQGYDREGYDTRNYSRQGFHSHEIWVSDSHPTKSCEKILSSLTKMTIYRDSVHTGPSQSVMMESFTNAYSSMKYLSYHIDDTWMIEYAYGFMVTIAFSKKNELMRMQFHLDGSVSYGDHDLVSVVGMETFDMSLCAKLEEKNISSFIPDIFLKKASKRSKK